MSRLFARDELYLGGQWRHSAGAERLGIVSPSTGEPLGSVPAAVRADVDLALVGARAAFDAGPWPRMSLDERAAMLASAAKALAERGDELGLINTSQLGVPTSQASGAYAGGLIDFFISLAREVEFVERREGPAGTALVMREPVGVVASIGTWNGPLFLAISKVVPALLAGCCVVFKSAPETPLDAFVVAESMSAADLPPGVLSIVTGGVDVGVQLVEDPRVDKVSFTGSTVVGRQIAATCGRNLKRVSLELGGKSAAIVLDDARLDDVVKGMRAGAFNNTGQQCNGLTRLLVPRSRRDEIVTAVCEMADAIQVGDPFRAETEMGPLVSERHRERVERYLQIGKNEGATVAVGGGRPTGLDRGWFVEPTVFTDVRNDMTIAQEEIFGPVLSVIDYESVDDAVRIANDSDYGLHGAVFTADVRNGVEIAKRVRTGMFSVNGHINNVAAPFGGVKASGMGRELGVEGVLDFTEYKTVNVPELT
jgi:aldehyde dehydrogenase (NAD+)